MISSFTTIDWSSVINLSDYRLRIGHISSAPRKTSDPILLSHDDPLMLAQDLTCFFNERSQPSSHPFHQQMLTRTPQNCQPTQPSPPSLHFLRMMYCKWSTGRRLRPVPLILSQPTSLSLVFLPSYQSPLQSWIFHSKLVQWLLSFDLHNIVPHSEKV